MMERLEKADPEIAQLIRREHQRQNETLELIASENHVSIPVLKALGSVLTDKYAEGYPAKRWYCGCENMDDVEQIAIDRAKKLFGTDHANVQPHSGTSANIAVYLAALKPGGKIMGMDLAHGGHLSHGLKINLSGKFYETASYGVEKDTERLDMDRVREQVLAERPDMLVAGASAYSRQIDFAAFGAIAKEAGCLLLADVAHIAGLVVTKLHPDPNPHADFITTTNHKTLRGPRGGIILCNEQWAKKIDQAIFPGIQGGPLMHAIAAKAVSFLEALQPEFTEYIRDVITNARTMAEELSEKGWRLVSGGTDNHLLMIDLQSRLPDVTGHEAALWLADANIVCNKNAIPFDPRPPAKASGLRLGSPAVTTRGLGKEQIVTLVEWIDAILMSNGDAQTIAKARAVVADLCEQFPVPNHNL
jgi:glycine hydroxymethyltransferase